MRPRSLDPDTVKVLFKTACHADANVGNSKSAMEEQIVLRRAKLRASIVWVLFPGTMLNLHSVPRSHRVQAFAISISCRTCRQ